MRLRRASGAGSQNQLGAPVSPDAAGDGLAAMAPSVSSSCAASAAAVAAASTGGAAAAGPLAATMR